jgi:hypothetical protein
MRILIPIFLLVSSINLFANVYEVGPGKEFVTPNDVPWESIEAGDTIKIFYRENPYKSKWVICVVGNEDNPIVVHGVADGDGNLPIIDGENATTRSEINYWNEERSIIKIGGANTPEDVLPEHIIVENLDIRGGRPPMKFTGRHGESAYDFNASAIFVEKGKNITLRNCIFRDCGNGLFVANGSSDVLVEYCYIHSNGNPGRYLEHNSYTEADGIIFQFNRYGFLAEGCDGNNLKDRSAGLIVRYNWIEGGNRQLDLVDSHADHIKGLTKYDNTYVYGNILIEREGEGNSQIIHFGGDSGTEDDYRPLLYLIHNTIISTRSGNTTLIRLSSKDQFCIALNNIVYTTAPGNKLALINGEGSLSMSSAFMKPGWIKDHSHGSGSVDTEFIIDGDDPGFVDLTNDIYLLRSDSPCINKGGVIADGLFRPVWEYIKHRKKQERELDSEMDLGAFEYVDPTGLEEMVDKELLYPNPVQDKCLIPNPKNESIKIFNIQSEIVLETLAYDDYTWQPDESLENGLYLVKVGMKTYKVILLR